MYTYMYMCTHQDISGRLHKKLVRMVTSGGLGIRSKKETHCILLYCLTFFYHMHILSFQNKYSCLFEAMFIVSCSMNVSRILGLLFFFSIFKDFIYLFQTEQQGGRKTGREVSMCGCNLHAPYWGPGLQPGMCPDWESNW